MSLIDAGVGSTPATEAEALTGPAAAGAGPRALLEMMHRLAQQGAYTVSCDMRQNALLIFVVRVMSAGLLFGSQILLARWMGAADYGIYVSLWTAVLVVGGLSHLGLNMTMMRLVPQYLASGSMSELRGLLRGGRLFAVLMGTMIAIAGATGILIAGDAVRHDLVVPLLLALACLPMYALSDVQDGIGRGQRWTLEGIVPPYLLRPAIVLALIAIAHIARIPASAALAMAAAAGATWVAAIVQGVLIERRLSETVERGFRQFAFSKWMSISLPLLAVGGCELVMQNTDVLMLNLYRPSAEIGIYYAAAKTTTLALFVHYAVGSAYAGRIARAGTLGRTDELGRLVHDAVKWTFWPTLAITAAVLALGLPLLSLFGPEFTAAYPMMAVLSAGILARAATGPSEVVLNMLGQQKACAKAYATAAAVCIGLNALLIPVWGAFGASIATATAITTAAALNWASAHRLLKLNVFVLAQPARPAAARQSV